jgi:hypothetical protein
MGKAEREEMQNSARALEQPSRLGQYVVGALHDIHRRVFEEGWFGKTVHDVVSHYQYNPRRDPSQATRDDQDAGKASEHDYSPDTFFGRNQEKESQVASMDVEQEEDLGMER